MDLQNLQRTLLVKYIPNFIFFTQYSFRCSQYYRTQKNVTNFSALRYVSMCYEAAFTSPLSCVDLTIFPLSLAAFTYQKILLCGTGFHICNFIKEIPQT